MPNDMNQAYLIDQRDVNREELARILAAEGMTSVLDLLAGLAEEKSELEGDRMEQIAQLVQKCSNACEHQT